MADQNNLIPASETKKGGQRLTIAQLGTSYGQQTSRFQNASVNNDLAGSVKSFSNFCAVTWKEGIKSWIVIIIAD